MRFFKYILVFLLLGGCITTSFAQEEDIQLWSGFSIGDKISKKLKWSVNSQFRMNNNVSEFKSVLVSPGLRYRLNKRFKLGLDYRYTRTPRTNRNRIVASLYYNKKIIKRTRIYGRLRWQRDYETNEIPYNRLRGKVTIDYNPKGTKFTPSVYTETFYLMSYEGHFVNRQRIGVQGDFDLGKKQNLAVRLIRQLEINGAPNKNSFIVTIGYSLGL